MSCCPPGSWPQLQTDYEAVGKETQLEGKFLLFRYIFKSHFDTICSAENCVLNFVFETSSKALKFTKLEVAKNA